ncbi:MAG: hypothetical protein WBB36_04305, partial [Chitinophagales bacterium]
MSTAHNKRLLIFGAVYFLIYLAGAVIFYKERIFLDGAYYFFHVVQSENFWVEHQRFILIASQLLLLTGVKLHLTLQTLLLLNSVNPVLYLFFFFFICVIILKDEAAGWTLLFLGACGVYFLYFVPMYEVWYGAVLLVFFSSLLQRQFYRTPLQLAILCVIVLSLLFSYPLMIIGFVFFTCYHFLAQRRLPWKVAVLFILMVICWLTWKSLFISDYENGKVSYPFSRIGTTLRENFTPLSNIKSLILFLFTVYGEAMIMLLLTVSLLLYRRNYLKTALILGFTIGFILMINITHNFPWNHSNYFERMYLLLIPLCMLPFLREVYHTSKQKLGLEMAFLLIIIYRGVQIVQHSAPYSDRIVRVEQFVESAQGQDGSKFFVKGED